MALNPANIKYLAFEGGGGKGASYLGAIHALEKLGILPYDNNQKLIVDPTGNTNKPGITGISGASAGAITAVLIGSGHSSKEIRRIFADTNFNSFFDLPFYVRDQDGIPFKFDPNDFDVSRLFKDMSGTNFHFREIDSKLIPGSEANWNLWKNNIKVLVDHLNDPTKELDFLKNWWAKNELFSKTYFRPLAEFIIKNLFFIFFFGKNVLSSLNILSGILVNFNNFLKSTFIQLGNHENQLENVIKEWIKANPDFAPETKERLTNFLNHYLSSLYLDYGLFSGTAIHEKFDEWITAKYSPSPGNNSAFAQKKRTDPNVKNLWLTFEEFHREFKEIDLKFVAVNITSGAIEVLSKDTTPKLCVATAARMSMSLPLVFKPINFNAATVTSLQLNTDKVIDYLGVDNNNSSVIKHTNIWEGYWLDGGFFDNAPIRAWGKKIENAILLRLGPRYIHNEIKDIISFITALGASVGNLGSGQVTETNYPFPDHLIELDVAGTATLKFDYTKVDSNGVKTFDIDIATVWVNNFNRVVNKFTAPTVTPDPGIFSRVITP